MPVAGPGLTSGRIQAFGGLSSLPQGFFFCQNVRLRIFGPAFGQILSDFVKFVSDFARFGQIWTASKPASTTKSDWAGKRQTEPRQAGARLGLPVRLARKSARLAFDYPDKCTNLKRHLKRARCSTCS